MGKNKLVPVEPVSLRQRLFNGWEGCSNHGCVVVDPKPGMMRTNGSCQCVVNASRSQLYLLQGRIQTVLSATQQPVEQQDNVPDGWRSRFLKLMGEIQSELDESDDDPIPSELWSPWRELLDTAPQPTEQMEPVGWQFYDNGKWWNGDDRIKDHRKNTEADGYPIRDVYAAPQPAPDVAGLVEVLEGLLGVIDESRGVSGYHLNGEIAEWDEFQAVHDATAALAAYRKQQEGEA